MDGCGGHLKRWTDCSENWLELWGLKKRSRRRISFWISNPSMISSSGPPVCVFVCLFVLCPATPPGPDGCTAVVIKKEKKKKVMVELLQKMRERGVGRAALRFDWSVCPETQWSALASAQRALDCTAPMIALKGQQKARLPRREWEEVGMGGGRWGMSRKPKIDFHFRSGVSLAEPLGTDVL